MTLNEFQEKAKSTDNYTNHTQALMALVLGVSGEAGEVTEEFKKYIREAGMDFDELPIDFVKRVIEELGDVLWNIAVLADYLKVDLETVALVNNKKLDERYGNGKNI